MFELSLTTIFPFALLAALPIFALVLSAFNLLLWPRGEPSARLDGGLSVLIPARDEEANIERCVRAIFEAGHPLLEVLVYEDCSSDQTPAILARLQREFPTLRVLNGQPLPPGWVGKPHACARLAEASKGELLLFVDADTHLKKGAIARLASLKLRHDAALVSAVPEQISVSFFERLILPLLHLSYSCWLPLPLIWKTHDPRFLAINGQVMMMRRDALAAVGGFEAVRDEIVDDMAMARCFKVAQKRVVFADGFRVASCRMYRSAREVWEGFSKNIFEGMGGSLAVFSLVLLIYTTTFVLPYMALAALVFSGQTAGAWWTAALMGVGANLALRAMMALRMRQPIEGILLHPVAVLSLLAIAFNSMRWSRRNEVVWSGRSYAGREQRNAPAQAANQISFNKGEL